MRVSMIWSVVLVLAVLPGGCGKGPATSPYPPGVDREITIELGDGVAMELVLVPAGEFITGHKQGCDSQEPHKGMIIRPFYLGKYEVTQGQWGAVMGGNPSEFKGAKNPVENVSWEDCQAFVAKLNEKSGADGGEFSLPTEAQWEYACQAGATTAYGFGDDFSSIGDYAWYAGNSDKKTHPVGQKKPNGWGVYDMYGNVAEWCADRYSDDSPFEDPLESDSFEVRAWRGGSWGCDHPEIFRSRWSTNFPSDRHNNRGFRVARTLAP